MNNDLISRSALLEAIAEEFFKTDPTGEEQLGYLACSRIVREFPTVDAEVVRCKDCVHYNHAVIDDDSVETFEVDVCLHKDLFPTRVTPDFYCAHGERKINAEVQDVPQD